MADRHLVFKALADATRRDMFERLTAGQTRVDFAHRHLDRMGEAAASTRDGIDGGWGGILQGYTDVVRAA